MVGDGNDGGHNVPLSVSADKMFFALGVIGHDPCWMDRELHGPFVDDGSQAHVDVLYPVGLEAAGVHALDPQEGALARQILGADAADARSDAGVEVIVVDTANVRGRDIASFVGDRHDAANEAGRKVGFGHAAHDCSQWFLRGGNHVDGFAATNGQNAGQQAHGVIHAR